MRRPPYRHLWGRVLGFDLSHRPGAMSGILPPRDLPRWRFARCAEPAVLSHVNPYASEKRRSRSQFCRLAKPRLRNRLFHTEWRPWLPSYPLQAIRRLLGYRSGRRSNGTSPSSKATTKFTLSASVSVNHRRSQRIRARCRSDHFLVTAVPAPECKVPVFIAFRSEHYCPLGPNREQTDRPRIRDLVVSCPSSHCEGGGQLRKSRVLGLFFIHDADVDQLVGAVPQPISF